MEVTIERAKMIKLLQKMPTFMGGKAKTYVDVYASGQYLCFRSKHGHVEASYRLSYVSCHHPYYMLERYENSEWKPLACKPNPNYLITYAIAKVLFKVQKERDQKAAHAFAIGL